MATRLVRAAAVDDDDLVGSGHRTKRAGDVGGFVLGDDRDGQLGRGEILHMAFAQLTQVPQAPGFQRFQQALGFRGAGSAGSAGSLNVPNLRTTGEPVEPDWNPWNPGTLFYCCLAVVPVPVPVVVAFEPVDVVVTADEVLPVSACASWRLRSPRWTSGGR